MLPTRPLVITLPLPLGDRIYLQIDFCFHQKTYNFTKKPPKRQARSRCTRAEAVGLGKR